MRRNLKKKKEKAKVPIQDLLCWIDIDWGCKVEKRPALHPRPPRMLHVHACADKDDTEPLRLEGPNFLHQRFTGIRW